ncbi:transcriptional regulator family: Fungal Specific TF [Aspergillus niger]|nr:transcriptional regulator family: Fungal Specific TF [Aspergillus niger]KAI3030949.1 transcriptional regulator family: Fungal Specific TF [Aspergillus niger]KAI3080125.1 transcriptional regulator family: Fungal Specific TF [Aspergillus niger]
MVHHGVKYNSPNSFSQTRSNLNRSSTYNFSVQVKPSASGAEFCHIAAYLGLNTTSDTIATADLEPTDQWTAVNGEFTANRSADVLTISAACTSSDNSYTWQIRGMVSKTRVFGQGHWMNIFSLTEGLPTLQPLMGLYDIIIRNTSHGPLDAIADKMAQCKRLARSIKSQRPSRSSLPTQIHQSLPSPDVILELAQLYFATFESCYRILRKNPFMAHCQTYLNNHESADTCIVLQILLVVSIAGPLHQDANVRINAASKAAMWIYTAQTWLSAPLEKSRLTLGGIQLHCLLLLARQVNQVGADLIWISTGSLMRIAMQMGLHQDPNCLSEMDPTEKGLRRRLWYTILELNLQSSLDSGMLPMIATGDWNTEPPSDHNLDAEPEIGEREESAAHKSMNLQPILSSSIPLRLHASRLINDLREEPPYEEVLEVGKELASACRDISLTLDQLDSASPLDQFASSFCTHLIRRFTLCLHYKFAIKAKINPLYSHSRKAGVEAALDIISLVEDNLYGRVLRCGGGMFRDIVTRAAILIFSEASPDPEAESSSLAKRRDYARQGTLLRDARCVVHYAKDRIYHGETNVKVYIFYNMMLAQAEARLSGQSEEEAVSRTMHESVDACYGMMQDMVAMASISSGPDTASFGDSLNRSDVSGEPLDRGFDSIYGSDFNFDFPDLQLFAGW